jgi:uncharacterized protein YndB with AHSA1/START domain
MAFTNFTTNGGRTFGGRFLELVPNVRIRHTDAFDDANLPGEMQATISLKPVFCGTQLDIVPEGTPQPFCLGWQESLALLAQLVEAEIPA